MFDQSKGNLRPVGVRLAENQSTEQAPEMSITGIADVEFKIMEWGDERGIKHKSLVLMVFNKDGKPEVWLPPGPEAWIVGCKPFAKSIQEQFQARYEAHLSEVYGSADPKPQVPEKDAVDILGGKK